jgi:hypothetical protein
MTDCAATLKNMPPPGFIRGNEDDTLGQMVALANEEGQELTESFAWQALTRTAVRPAVDGSVDSGVAVDQGSLEEIAPGFAYLLDDTLWIQDQPFKLIGPMSAQQRTSLEAWNVSGATWTFWIEQNHLWVSRSTVSSQTLRLRYQSRFWAKRFVSDGVYTEADSMAADMDTCVFPERLIKLGVLWRWLSTNGLPFQQEYINYSKARGQYWGREGTKTVLSASGQGMNYDPRASILGGTMRVNA